MTYTPARRAAVDWDAVHERLRRSNAALREAMSDTPARMNAVFRRRALQLAKESTTKEAVSKTTLALVFRLGQEHYALALSELAEVTPFRGCVPVPGAVPEILGVMNRRREIQPIVDLARVLNGSASTDSGEVLMLRRQAGLKVDRAEELRNIATPDAAPLAEGRFCRPVSGETLAMLDVEALLSGVFPLAAARFI